MNLALLEGAVELGLVWSFMTIGVYLSYRLLKMPDLTAEGSLVLGAGWAARLIVDGHSPWVALLAAALIGGLAGLITGILHTKFEIPGILAGILTMIASHSIALRVMGTGNIGLGQNPRIFTFLQDAGLSSRHSVIVIGLAIVILVSLLLYWFFSTEIGSAVRAVGHNREVTRSFGINNDVMIISCLMLSNAVIAFGGGILAQQSGFVDVGSLGGGTIAIGLASLIIAEVILNTRSIIWRLLTLSLGTIVYYVIIAIVLELGMRPSDMRMFQALTVVSALSLPILKRKIAERKFVDDDGEEGLEGGASHA